MLRQTFSSAKDIKKEETMVKTLGESKINAPKAKMFKNFELANKRVLVDPFLDNNKTSVASGPSFEVSGPAFKIFFDPSQVRAGIVTCGGLCPGLNSVIRSLVLTLYYSYNCNKVLGIRYGLKGFISKYNLPPVELTPKFVSNLHDTGGTILGSSRGPQPVFEIVDTLERLKINQLYIIGGDGSLRAAEAIYDEIAQRKLNIALVGIPKTIDNDIPMSSESFGFETAVDVAARAIKSAHVEAKSHLYGIGMVKLMGRESGFVSAVAALSQRDVNFILIPEHDFDLEGPQGLLKTLEYRILLRKHAVIVVAEGAGQKFFNDKAKNKKTDASGNKTLNDIGIFLKQKIKEYFAHRNIPIDLKYIDPSYMIRSVNSNTRDNLFAATLGQNAVHALMAGKTNMMVSVWHGVYCNVPLPLVNKNIKRLSLNGRIWTNLIESTGQPPLKNKKS